jgi:hypothetical protein
MPVSAAAWKVVSSTGLANSRKACALTAATGPHACEGMQRSADNKTCVCTLGYSGTMCQPQSKSAPGAPAARAPPTACAVACTLYSCAEVP